MKKTYIFDYEAIPIVKEAFGAGGKGQWSVIAETYEEAKMAAVEYFKSNVQFRFEFRLALIDL